MTQNVVLIISVLAIFDLLLIGIFSWIKSIKIPYYFWLGCMHIATSLAILDNIFIFEGKGTLLIYHIGLISNVAFGAYTLEFVRCIRKIEEKRLKVNIILFLPVALYLPFLILSIIQPHWVNDAIELAKTGQMTIFGVFYNFIICGYSIFANIIILWQEYFKKEKYRVSDKQSKLIKELMWIMLMLQCFAFIPFMLRLDVSYIILYMPVFGQIFFIYIFARMTFSTQMNLLVENSNNQVSVNTKKYSTVKITEVQVDEVLNKITTLMQTDKPYMVIDYSLSQLSKDTRISINILSMVINSKLNSTFPDYINSFRINNAIELMKTKNKKNYTIESIAYESGFNNRTSFYKAFKKQTGKLPSDYIKTVLETEKVV